MSMSGTVTKTAPDGTETPLAPGAILKQGDELVVGGLSEVELVFSNGSEVTVKERTSVSIAKLQQEAFSGNQSYEQLQADPSKSQTMLDLNYGSVDFHVKKLQAGSKFDIQTPLGTAAIRGTRGTITLLFNRARNEFTLQVSNVDGLVDFSSTFAGNLVFGPGNTATVGLDSTQGSKTEGVPQGSTVVMRVRAGDPGFQAVVNAIKPFIPPSTPQPVVTPTPPPGASGNENDDLGIIVVSPEGQSTSSTSND